jgi:hypothetical protein
MNTLKLTDGSDQPELKAEQVRLANSGKTQTLYRNNLGMFSAPKQERLTRKEIAEATIARLTDDSNGKSKYQEILDNVAKNAALDCMIPVYTKSGEPVLDAEGNQIRVPDARVGMVSAKSLDTLSKIMGLPEKEEQQVGHRVEILLIHTPQLMHPEVRPYEAHSAPQPAWIEGEFTETNEPHTPQPVPQAPAPRKVLHVKEVSVGWLLGRNTKAINAAKDGKMCSVILKAAETETLQIREDGTILSGVNIVLSANINDKELLRAEVCE